MPTLGACAASPVAAALGWDARGWGWRDGLTALGAVVYVALLRPVWENLFLFEWKRWADFYVSLLLRRTRSCGLRSVLSCALSSSVKLSPRLFLGTIPAQCGGAR